tara:strand:+ start:1520 stop:1696 length:177 start_codon:yes stop_codon:yes gene_type:complete
MKDYSIDFKRFYTCRDEQQAKEHLLKYLKRCVECENIMGFDVTVIKNEDEEKENRKEK